MISALKFLTRYAQERDEFLDSIVTGDETWVFHHSSESKQQFGDDEEVEEEVMTWFKRQPDANDTKITNRARETNVMLNESDYVFLKPRSYDWNTWRTCVNCGYLPRRGSSTLARMSNTSPFPPAVGRCDTR